jgi:hypothetical protein
LTRATTIAFITGILYNLLLIQLWNEPLNILNAIHSFQHFEDSGTIGGEAYTYHWQLMQEDLMVKVCHILVEFKLIHRLIAKGRIKVDLAFSWREAH